MEPEQEPVHCSRQYWLALDSTGEHTVPDGQPVRLPQAAVHAPEGKSAFWMHPSPLAQPPAHARPTCPASVPAPPSVPGPPSVREPPSVGCPLSAPLEGDEPEQARRRNGRP
jgi:hypothetical protein